MTLLDDIRDAERTGVLARHSGEVADARFTADPHPGRPRITNLRALGFSNVSEDQHVVLAAVAERGWIPANMHDLVRFARSHPSEWRNCGQPVLAPASDSVLGEEGRVLGALFPDRGGRLAVVGHNGRYDRHSTLLVMEP